MGRIRMMDVVVHVDVMRAENVYKTVTAYMFAVTQTVTAYTGVMMVVEDIVNVLSFLVTIKLLIARKQYRPTVMKIV